MKKIRKIRILDLCLSFSCGCNVRRATLSCLSIHTQLSEAISSHYQTISRLHVHGMPLLTDIMLL